MTETKRLKFTAESQASQDWIDGRFDAVDFTTILEELASVEIDPDKLQPFPESVYRASEPVDLDNINFDYGYQPKQETT